MVFELVQRNLVTVVIASFLILFLLTNNNFGKRATNHFLAAAICILVLTIEENWEWYLALSTAFQPLRVPLSALGYTLRPMIPYLLIMMKKRDSKAQAALLTAPLILNGLVSFSALLCGLSFSYTMDNQFVRGPLGLMPFFTAAFYVIVLLIQTNVSYRNGGFAEGMIISAIVIVSFFSTVLESLFGLRFIQNPCMATSVTFYYLFLHTNQSNRDPLTGALTRRRFYLDAEKSASMISAVISLDLNDLKTLNDKNGHKEGDRALITVSDIVKRYTGSRTTFYRTGGDEFMLLCRKMNEESIQRLIESIRRDLERTKYRCAIGYALYSYEVNFDHLCHIADSHMYEDKRRMKKLNAAKAGE